MSTTKEHSLSDSRALWNRNSLELDSDEVLAQILDRGDMKDWRALYLLCKSDPLIRARIHHVIRTVPLPLPHFWMAALRPLGEVVDWNEALPPSGESPI